MFDRAERVLRSQDASYMDVVRTRIYISDILDWYGEFNRVRNARYSQFGLMQDRRQGSGATRRFTPTSTGIQGDNPHGSACVMDVLAIYGEPGAEPDVTPMANVRQSEAPTYGSAFSRGMCVRDSGVMHIHVSGPAAIDERGENFSPGKCRAQALRTLDNVEALLAPHGASLQDICEATVFLKRAENALALGQALVERDLSEMSAVRVTADICRDDLLFEMDAAALLRVR